VHDTGIWFTEETTVQETIENADDNKIAEYLTGCFHNSPLVSVIGIQEYRIALYQSHKKKIYGR